MVEESSVKNSSREKDYSNFFGSKNGSKEECALRKASTVARGL